MRTAIQTMVGKLANEVQNDLAPAMRNPLEILEPASGFEEGLRTHSVKLREILGALREKHQFLDKHKIPHENLRYRAPKAFPLISENTSISIPLPRRCLPRTSL